jgi:hypothetical protein
MDTRELDRLVSKTEINPMVKIALRHVRKAVERGDVTGFKLDKNSWSVRVDNPRGISCTWVFYIRKEDNGNHKNTS